MKSLTKIIPGLICLMAISGCLGTWQKLKISKSVSPVNKYTEKAVGYEEQGELRAALLTWRIVARFDPENKEIPKKINALKRDITRRAREHYHRGLNHYQAGDYADARQAFLATLRLNPGHKRALYYLKTRLQHVDQAVYKVRRGDSYFGIATRIYNDPSKAYLLAHFNGFDPEKPLLTGTTLLLPALDRKYLLPRSDIKAMLAKARKALDEHRHDEVIKITAQIRKEVPNHPRALQLADDARFNQAMALMKNHRYNAALKQLKQVRAGYKGRNEAIRRARTEIKQFALEKRIALAKDHLSTGAYADVVKITEEILHRDPTHAMARQLFNTAHYALGRQLLDNGDEAGAVQHFDIVGPSFKDVSELHSLARARLKSQAETYYRAGVKFFINENLEKAIENWQRALELNPDHPKARQDMENATRLLKRWRALDKETPE